ncbi:hypothetical protein PILCRDRAFT_673104 [Piloderma croceum F 1598]|uniref:Heat shock protein 9/12 n=1 Tax=Piloderma croceum (strain F 1598) TaxID=765440 RepID=A0A0C3BDW4_PILCF|nr:hypothetical protein PILCRDRAFT_673104 [Piloderma croceum F 1598]
MSDNARQNFGDKASAALKPDSQKTTTEKIGDTVKGKTDSVASTLQPQGEKSNTQKAGDAVSGNANDNQDSLLDKAKNALGGSK